MLILKVPIAILNQAIRYGEKEELYSNGITSSPHGFEGTMISVVISSGRSEVWAEVEYRRRKACYKIFLTNNRTQEQKTIEGRWVEITPTGNIPSIQRNKALSQESVIPHISSKA